MVSGHHAPAFTVASLATMTAGAAFDLADPRDHAGSGRLAVVLVVSDQQADFEETRARVEQARDAFARGEFAGAVLLLDAFRAAAFPKFLFQMMQRFDEVAHVRRACDRLRGRWFFRHRRLVYRTTPAAPVVLRFTRVPQTGL